jgi:hypothetical protein
LRERTDCYPQHFLACWYVSSSRATQKRGADVSDQLRTHFDGLFDQLQSLRNAVEFLKKEERNHSLRGHQTVDSSEAIQLSFQKLQAAIKEMEDTLLMIAEATGEIGKL